MDSRGGPRAAATASASWVALTERGRRIQAHQSLTRPSMRFRWTSKSTYTFFGITINFLGIANCNAVSSSSSSSASSTSSTAMRSGFAGISLSGFLASSLSNSTVYLCKEKSQPLMTPPLPFKSARDLSSCRITFVPSGSRPPLSGRMWMTFLSVLMAPRSNSWPRRSKMSMYKRCRLSTSFPNSSSCTALNLPTAMPALTSSSSFTAPCSTREARTSRPRQGLSLCWRSEVMAQCICFTAVRVFRRWRCTVFGFSLR
mmetsp:Transcript_80607/g.226189  ORF Transcript_80607/g.226189 Transcript_80607/m.226189 type:complete len:258 (-) Transcript_80607:655-1428(-)